MTCFQEVSNLVENRRRELIEGVRQRRDEKRKVLKDQIEVISDEKKKLEKVTNHIKIEEIFEGAGQMSNGRSFDAPKLEKPRRQSRHEHLAAERKRLLTSEHG